MATFSFPLFRAHQDKGNLLAHFSVVVDELGLQLNEMALFQTSDGSRRFVRPPYREYTKPGEREPKKYEYYRVAWNDGWDPRGQQIFDDIAEAAYAEYLNQGGSASQGASRGGKAPAAARRGSAPQGARSGRGPVNPPPREGNNPFDDDSDSDLPF